MEGAGGMGPDPWVWQMCRSGCWLSAEGVLLCWAHPPRDLGWEKGGRPQTPRLFTENVEPGALVTCLLPAWGLGLGVCKVWSRVGFFLVFSQLGWVTREETIVLGGQEAQEGNRHGR